MRCAPLLRSGTCSVVPLDFVGKPKFKGKIPRNLKMVTVEPGALNHVVLSGGTWVTTQVVLRGPALWLFLT